jgi:molecular chaperone DnaK
MDEASRTNLEAKAAHLRQAVNDPAIQPAALQACLDELQSALFAVGASLYSDSGTNSGDGGFASYEPTGDDGGGGNVAGDEYEPDTPASDYDDDLDATVTADYEAID